MFTKQQKRVLSRAFNKGQAEPVAALSEESRTHWDAETETVSEYGFIEFEDWMDDSCVDLWFDQCMWRRIPEHLSWDCTGQVLTVAIDWHRNPNGLVSFIHRYQYDY